MYRQRFADVQEQINGLERIRITNDELLDQLRVRLELPCQQDLGRQSARLNRVRAYLEGKLLVNDPPQEKRRIDTDSLIVGNLDYHPLEPQDQSDREHMNRHKEIRGDEAQHAVLELAIQKAVQ